jgi:anthranilate/para-aminobenzoate synthase component I
MKTPFDIAADLDTPVSAYLKLAPFRPRFLLESVEGGERLARYSFIGFGECLEVRLDAAGLKPLMNALQALRGEVDRLEGTRIVSQCPVAMKEDLDVWGTVKDALPLMQRIKQKFDPEQTLNPGRFVGGI